MATTKTKKPLWVKTGWAMLGEPAMPTEIVLDCYALSWVLKHKDGTILREHRGTFDKPDIYPTLLDCVTGVWADACNHERYTAEKLATATKCRMEWEKRINDEAFGVSFSQVWHQHAIDIATDEGKLEDWQRRS